MKQDGKKSSDVTDVDVSQGAIEAKGDESSKNVTKMPGMPQPPSAPAPIVHDGPLTEEEVKKNAVEEDRRTMRVIQIIQHIESQKIEIHPVQNIKMRSDIIGILTQGLNNVQNEDITRNNASLLREAIALIKDEIKE